MDKTNYIVVNIATQPKKKEHIFLILVSEIKMVLYIKNNNIYYITCMMKSLYRKASISANKRVYKKTKKEKETIHTRAVTTNYVLA